MDYQPIEVGPLRHLLDKSSIDISSLMQGTKLVSLFVCTNQPILSCRYWLKSVFVPTDRKFSVVKEVIQYSKPNAQNITATHIRASVEGHGRWLSHAGIRLKYTP